MSDSKLSCHFCKQEYFGRRRRGSRKAAYYCSKDCIIKDFQSKKTGTDASKLGDCFKGASGFANAKPKPVKSDFAEALQRANGFYSERRVETKFESDIGLQNDEFSRLLTMVRLMKVARYGRGVLNSVLVVQIVRVEVEEFFIYNERTFVVMDEDGVEASLCIASPSNEPRSYHRWDNYKPGKFLCIVDASVQNIFGHLRGIRICDPREIMLLNKLD